MVNRPCRSGSRWMRSLTFHEQADGRKVARLPGGKVVLLDIHQVDRVADGERWHVRLRHKEAFAIADAVDLAREPSDVCSPAARTGLMRSRLPPRLAAPRDALAVCCRWRHPPG